MIQDPQKTFTNFSNLDIICRCKPTKHPPYNKVNVGDTIFVQKRGGPIEDKYEVSSVLSTYYNNIVNIRNLCKNSSLYYVNDWWNAQMEKGFATIIFLVQHKTVSPSIYRVNYSQGNAHDWIVINTLEKQQQWPGI